MDQEFWDDESQSQEMQEVIKFLEENIDEQQKRKREVYTGNKLKEVR